MRRRQDRTRGRRDGGISGRAARAPFRLTLRPRSAEWRGIFVPQTVCRVAAMNARLSSLLAGAAVAGAVAAATAWIAAPASGRADEPKQLNVYNWSDYI